MTTWDVGDIATITLNVTPSAPDTAATVLVTNPDGVPSSPATTPNGDKSVWTALFTITKAGDWVAKWNVTGTGGGVEYEPDNIQVRAAMPVATTGRRVYATTEHLANYLEPDPPPPGQRRALVRASERIDELLLTAVYAVDANGIPTDANIIAALRDAVCAQAVWWSETGDELGLASQYQNVSIGRVSLSRAMQAGGTTKPSRYAEQAITHLRLAISTDGIPLFPGTIWH